MDSYLFVFKTIVVNASKVLLFAKPWNKRSVYHLTFHNYHERRPIIRRCDVRALIDDFLKYISKAICDRHTAVDSFG